MSENTRIAVEPIFEAYDQQPSSLCNGQDRSRLVSTFRLWTNSLQVLQVSVELLRHDPVVDIQPVFSRRDQSQIGQNFEMMRQRCRGNGVFGMHLAAEQLIMLSNVRVNSQAVRVSESTCDLRNLDVLHSSHID